ncbi:MAG: hypothetical protein ACHQEM_02815 [Chitinophagales bacterium]
MRKHTGIPDAYSDSLNYNQLYFDKDKIHIGETRMHNGEVEILFEGKFPSEKSIDFSLIDDQGQISNGMGNLVLINAKAGGLHNYKILFNGFADTIGFAIDMDKDSPGQSMNSDYEITTNNVMGSAGLFGVRDWAMDYWGTDTIGVMEDTRRILSDSLFIRSGDTDAEKILKIGKFILYRTGEMDGRPDDALSNMHPEKQLRRVQSGKSRIWCGNYAAIFSWLASGAGLPVRLVSCGMKEGSKQTGIHVFCEAFLKEQREWVYVDLTARNILVSYHNKWLNAIDIQRLSRYEIKDPEWTAFHFSGDSIIKKPYGQVSAVTDHYFHANSFYHFYFAGYFRNQFPPNIFSRVKKFLNTGYYYGVYSDNLRTRNYLFYLRILTNYLLVFCFWYSVIGLVYLIRKNKSHN